MKIIRHILLVLLIQLLVATHYSFAQMETDHNHTLTALTNLPGRNDSELRARFLSDYRAAGREKRPVLKQYLSTLGADGIMDVFEQRNALCHSEAHDLGKEIFAQVQELGPGVQMCGNRCGSGCMHGLLWEAFLSGTEHDHHNHTLSLAEIKPKIKTICENKTFADTYEPGNCAHGVGHALLVLSSYDLGGALQSCSAFESDPLRFYCASGVFMEYDSHPHPEAETRSLHYPCDTYTEFPSACYRYRTRYFLRKARGNTAGAAEECLRLEPTQRRGCFYGLGAAHLYLVAKQPERLGSICTFGDLQDQGMCIKGVIEYLADYQPETVQKACGTLTGEQATSCSAAARNKRYGLEKDFALY